MSSICILTDSTAQFPQIGFSGRNDVRIVPFNIEMNGQIYGEGQEIRTTDLPSSANDPLHPRLIAPSAAYFQDLYTNLGQHYSDIITILISSGINPTIYANAQKAAESVRGRIRVSTIDSQTTSIGLGLLVQAAAEAMANGRSAADIERMIRSMIPHIYMMICTPGMSYLANAGLVDSGQAFVSEMLNLMPIFTLEEGQLSAVEKVRNPRGLLDFMQEFIMEFDDLLHIAFIQGTPALTHEARMMREHAQSCFAHTPFSEHTIQPHLAAILGPRTVGLVAVEKV